MGRKQNQYEPEPNELALRALSDMNYRDMQRACILKGMPFEDVSSKGAPALAQWYIANFENGNNPALLNEYDDWIEGELKLLGYKDGEAMLHPSFRFGYTAGFEKSTTIKSDPSRKEVEKPVKEKRQMDEKTGLVKGTKKALTRDCAVKGLSLAKTIEKVSKQFPDYNEKSVKIWYKQGLKNASK